MEPGDTLQHLPEYLPGHCHLSKLKHQSRKDGETLPAWWPRQARCPKTVVFDTPCVRCDIAECPFEGANGPTTRPTINVALCARLIGL